MTLKKAMPLLAAAGVVGLIWYLTRPRGSVSFGPLTQPIVGAGDELSGRPLGGLEPAPIAMQRPENLGGQGLSNAEVDRILDGYRADMRARGLPVYSY